MNKNVIEKMYSSTENVELAEVKVDLAVTDEVASELKSINQMLKMANDANNKIVKAAEQLNAAYKNVSQNLNYSKAKTARIDSLYKNLDKLAKELGVNVQSTDAFKGIQDAYQFLGQIQDAFDNIKTTIQTIGK
jgi:ABC-type transporter Mla subunit MlaD